MLQCPKCGSQNCKGSAKAYIAYCCDCGKTGEWGEFKPNEQQKEKVTITHNQESFFKDFHKLCKKYDITSVASDINGFIMFESHNSTLKFMSYQPHEGFDCIRITQENEISHFAIDPESEKLNKEFGF